MSERQPNPNYSFILNTNNGERLLCTPENTQAYLYEDEKYDHIFHIVTETENGWQGYHIFRHVVGKDFDEMIKRMINGGFDVMNAGEIDESDMKAYLKSLPVELETHEITPRQQHHIDFLHYLLEHDLLEEEDFEGDGDLLL